jgi:hypothetical protein
MYLKVRKENGLATVDEFLGYFLRVEMLDEEFNNERYIPGSTGESALYRDLLTATQLTASHGI